MKTTSNHLSQIILAVAAIALVVGIVLTFTTPIGGFFSGVTDKLQGIGTGSIWDLGEYGESGGSGGSGGSGSDEGLEESNVIKAGTYRFNDDISFNERIVQDLNFTVDAPEASMSVQCMQIGIIYNGVVDGVDTLGLTFVSTEEISYTIHAENEWKITPDLFTVIFEADQEVDSAFAKWFAENTVKQEESNVIKAGTYRFNDVVTLLPPSYYYEVEFDFILPSIIIDSNSEPVVGYRMDVSERTITYQSIVKETPLPIVVYITDDKWNTASVNHSSLFPEGYGQTITIPEDTDMTDYEEFYEWFTANTKPVIEVDELPTENIDTSAIYKTYEYLDIDSTDPTTLVAGTYRFNDVLTSLNGSFPLSFTCAGYIDKENPVFYPDGIREYNSIYVCNYIGGYWMLGYESADGSREFYKSDEWYWDYWYYFGLQNSVDFGESIKGWGQTISVTEDTEVDVEFGTWFASNAKQRVQKCYQYVDGAWVEFGA